LVWYDKTSKLYWEAKAKLFSDVQVLPKHSLPIIDKEKEKQIEDLRTEIVKLDQDKASLEKRVVSLERELGDLQSEYSDYRDRSFPAEKEPTIGINSEIRRRRFGPWMNKVITGSILVGACNAEQDENVIPTFIFGKTVFTIPGIVLLSLLHTLLFIGVCILGLKTLDTSSPLRRVVMLVFCLGVYAPIGILYLFNNYLYEFICTTLYTILLCTVGFYLRRKILQSRVSYEDSGFA
jgi:hypothetical protein